MESSINRTADVLNKDVDAPSLFNDLLLSPTTLQGLAEAGFITPSPIQAKAIPLGRCGLDLIVQAKSGTGKTLVFGVIALEALTSFGVGSFGNRLQVLILSPTREIAVQSQRVLTQIGKFYENLKVSVFIGGLPTASDLTLLSGCQVAVGSPGRIKALIMSGDLRTDAIRLLILDEADLLLHQNFQPTINWIYSTLPESKQILALSATYTEQLADHLLQYMKNPTFVRLNAIDPALLGIRQYYFEVEAHHLPNLVFDKKAEKLIYLLRNISFQQCLVFSNYQTRAEDLSRLLTARGWPSVHIGSALEQTRRLEVYEQLKSFACRVLVTTDLSSRGIDAENVDLVVNLDLPWEHETYLHRIGRAGRFGRYGAAVSLVSSGSEISMLKNIERDANTEIKQLTDPVPSNLTASVSVLDLESLVTTQVIRANKDLYSESSQAHHKDKLVLRSKQVKADCDDGVVQLCELTTMDAKMHDISTHLSTAQKLPTLADEMNLLGIDKSSLSNECQAELDAHCVSPVSQHRRLESKSFHQHDPPRGSDRGKKRFDKSKESFARKQPRSKRTMNGAAVDSHCSSNCDVSVLSAAAQRKSDLDKKLSIAPPAAPGTPPVARRTPPAAPGTLPAAAPAAECAWTKKDSIIEFKELNMNFVDNDFDNFLSCIEKCFPSSLTHSVVKSDSIATSMPTWSDFHIIVSSSDAGQVGRLQQEYRSAFDQSFASPNCVTTAEFDPTTSDNLDFLLQRLISQCKLKKIKRTSSSMLAEVSESHQRIHQSIQTDNYEHLQSNGIEATRNQSETTATNLPNNDNYPTCHSTIAHDYFIDESSSDEFDEANDLTLREAIEVAEQQLIQTEAAEKYYLQLYQHWCERYETALYTWLQQQEP